MQDREWVHAGDDALWRRSKLGLHYTPAQRAAVGTWLDSHQKE
jgi:glycerol-3-phosphate dehydrogenase